MRAAPVALLAVLGAALALQASPRAAAAPAAAAATGITASPALAAPSAQRPAVPAASAAAAAQDIRDIRGPRPVPSPWLPWLLGGAALAASLALFAIWRWMKRRRITPAPTDLDVALARLEAAQSLLQENRARDFSIEVSATVREYIERRFAVMAAHRTTHEFLHDLMDSSHAELARYRDLLGEFLQLCDLAKFGGWNLRAAQMTTMLESARRFVRSAAESQASPAAGSASVNPQARPAARSPHVSFPST